MPIRAHPGYLAELETQCGERLDRFQHNSRALEGFALDDHQRIAMRELHIAVGDRMRSAQNSAFSIVHGCGSGKTVLEANMLCASQDAKVMAECRDDRMDILVTSERSIAQDLQKKLCAWGLDTGIWLTGKRTLDRPVLVTTHTCLQSNTDVLHTKLPTDRIDLLLGDEADTYLTKQRKDAIALLKPTMKVGLTATDEWMDGRHISDMWGPVLHRYPMSSGIADGINAPPLYYLFEATGIDESKLKMSGGDYDQHSLARALQEAHVEQMISEVYKAIVPDDMRMEFPGMIKVGSVDLVHEVTREMQRQFAEEGLEIRSWTGRTTPRGTIDRDVADFNEGKVHLIVVCDMGGRGLDLLRCRLLIDCDPTQSKTKLMQLHGRPSRQIREGSPLWNMGVRKPFTLTAQVVPRSTRFRPLCLPDVLNAWDDASKGKPLLSNTIRKPQTDREPEGVRRDELRRIKQHIATSDVEFDVRLLEKVDLYRQISSGIPLSQRLDENGEVEINGVVCVGISKFSDMHPDVGYSTLLKRIEEAEDPSIPIMGYAHSYSQLVPVYEKAAIEGLEYVQQAYEMNGKRIFNENGEVEIDGIVCIGVIKAFTEGVMVGSSLHTAIRKANLPIVGVARVPSRGKKKKGHRTIVANAYDKDAVEALEYVQLARAARRDVTLGDDGLVTIDGIECIAPDKRCRHLGIAAPLVKKTAEKALPIAGVVKSHTKFARVYTREGFEGLEEYQMAMSAKRNGFLDAQGEIWIDGVRCVGIDMLEKKGGGVVRSAELKKQIAAHHVQPRGCAYSGTRPIYVYALADIEKLEYVRIRKLAVLNRVNPDGTVTVPDVCNIVDTHYLSAAAEVVGDSTSLTVVSTEDDTLQDVDPCAVVCDFPLDDSVMEERLWQTQSAVESCMSTIGSVVIDVFACNESEGSVDVSTDDVVLCNGADIALSQDALDLSESQYYAGDDPVIDAAVTSFHTPLAQCADIECIAPDKYAKSEFRGAYRYLHDAIEEARLQVAGYAMSGTWTVPVYRRDEIEKLDFVVQCRERATLSSVDRQGIGKIGRTEVVSLRKYAERVLGIPLADLEQIAADENVKPIGRILSGGRGMDAYKKRDIDALPIEECIERRKAKVDANGVGRLRNTVIVTARRYAEQVLCLSPDVFASIIADEGIEPIGSTYSGDQLCDAYKKADIDMIEVVAERLAMPLMGRSGIVSVQGVHCVDLKRYARTIGVDSLDIFQLVETAGLIPLGEARCTEGLCEIFRRTEVDALLDQAQIAIVTPSLIEDVLIKPPKDEMPILGEDGVVMLFGEECISISKYSDHIEMQLQTMRRAIERAELVPVGYARHRTQGSGVVYRKTEVDALAAVQMFFELKSRGEHVVEKGKHLRLNAIRELTPHSHGGARRQSSEEYATGIVTVDDTECVVLNSYAGHIGMRQQTLRRIVAASDLVALGTVKRGSWDSDAFVKADVDALPAVVEFMELKAQGLDKPAEGKQRLMLKSRPPSRKKVQAN